METPSIVIDVAVARRNVLRMQAAADVCGVRVRPHVKTHKMPEFMHMQLGAGARGITCAKVSEAEVMADAGAEDIFIAYPAIGEERIRRVLKLSERIPRLIVGVDSADGARMLHEAAERAGASVEVRLEIDTGRKRTGVQVQDALELARYVSSLDRLRLTGIFTFKSMMLNGEATLDAQAAALEEGDLMNRVAVALRGDGINIEDVSAGSTPTGLAVAKTGLVNEIRPGTYIFNDMTLVKEGVAAEEDIAARIYARVVSVSGDRAVIDGGTKTFPMDVTPNAPPFFFPGYAVAAGRPDLRLSRMNEEHGMLTSDAGAVNLRVGQVLEFLPLHVCTAINLQNEVYLLEDGELRSAKVAARGMLR